MHIPRKFMFFVLFLLIAVLSAGCSGEALPYSLAPKSMMPSFVHNASARVMEAYQFATANMDEMQNYPCYCGCGAMGHISNLDCYIQNVDNTGRIIFDTHGAGCGICIDITQDVMRMLREGRASPEIRAYIDATYSKYGPSTNTPLPE